MAAGSLPMRARWSEAARHDQAGPSPATLSRSIRGVSEGRARAPLRLHAHGFSCRSVPLDVLDDGAGSEAHRDVTAGRLLSGLSADLPTAPPRNGDRIVEVIDDDRQIGRTEGREHVVRPGEHQYLADERKLQSCRVTEAQPHPGHTRGGQSVDRWAEVGNVEARKGRENDHGPTLGLGSVTLTCHFDDGRAGGHGRTRQARDPVLRSCPPSAISLARSESGGSASARSHPTPEPRLPAGRLDAYDAFGTRPPYPLCVPPDR